VDPDGYGQLANPQAWRDVLPDPLFEALTKWIVGRPFTLTHLRWRTEGKSGSYVASVRIQPHRGKLSGAILKIVPADLGDREMNAVQLAEQFGPADFVETHLAKTIWIGALPGSAESWLHIQEVAQSGIATMHPLSKLIEDQFFAEHCATIIQSVVCDWNPGTDDAETVVVEPGKYLREDLAKKMPGLKDFSTAADLNLGNPGNTIKIPGRPGILPNPFKLLQSGITAPETTIFRGKGHGDLHLDNILVPISPGSVHAECYRLVDFGRFSPHLPISRDPAKLMLSVASSWLPGLAPESAIRSSLAELTVSPSGFPTSAPIAGYLRVAASIYTAAAQWSIQRMSMEEWREQHSLVLAAAAMRTVARADLQMSERWWHLEVAALALRPFLPVVEDGHAVEPPPPTPPTARRQHQPHDSRTAQSSEGVRSASSAAKLDFSHRLGESWQDLAGALEIRSEDMILFPLGNEARGIWEWLEVRGQLSQLRRALGAIGRDDLLDATSDLF
jgi:hypothetical protein